MDVLFSFSIKARKRRGLKKRLENRIEKKKINREILCERLLQFWCETIHVKLTTMIRVHSAWMIVMITLLQRLL